MEGKREWNENQEWKGKENGRTNETEGKMERKENENGRKTRTE